MTWPTRELGHGVVEHRPGMSWRAFAEGLVHEPTQRDTLTEICATHDGLFWECVPTARARAQEAFRFVTVPSPAVAALRPDRGPFRAQLRRAQGPTATFDNLGHDAVLVAPVGAVPGGCAHLAAWCRTAPPAERHALWSAVGKAVLAWWHARDDAVWVSTSGLGVAWLHIRLDERPKYVTHRPYRRLAPMEP